MNEPRPQDKHARRRVFSETWLGRFFGKFVGGEHSRASQRDPDPGR